jgi:tetratricopeptide (TPR) repeat protein
MGKGRSSAKVRQPCTAVFLALLGLLLITSLPCASQQPSAVPYSQVKTLMEQGKLPQAEHLLRAALGKQPRNAQLLDWLGVVLDAEHQFPRAEHCYKEALALSPHSAPILNNLGNHYLTEGKPQLARQAYLEAIAIDPNSGNANLQLARLSVGAGDGAGALTYLHRLPPELRSQPAVELLHASALHLAGQGRAAHALLKGLEQQAGRDLRVAYSVGLTFASWKDNADAEQAFNRVLALHPDAETLGECGRTLLVHGQYALAQRFLEKAVSAGPAQTGAELDLAIAVYHTQGPSAGLSELDRVPANLRDANYLLLKAQMLDAEGKGKEAAGDLNQALGEATARPGFYFQAAQFLLKHGRYQQALDFSQHAVQRFPKSRRLTLIEAMSYGMTGHSAEGENLLKQIELRWPQWDQPYLIEGIMLVDHSHPRQAKPRLETAIRLGAHEAIAYYNLAEADMSPASPDLAGATRAIHEALQLDPSDPYAQSLAARIAFEQKDYPAAQQYAAAALRLWPDMLEAHQTLSAVYRALGEREKSAAELKAILRIKQKLRSPVQAPPRYPTRLLFSVSVPHSGF